MIYLIHGDDVAASRNYFLSQKQTHTEIVTLNGQTVTLNEITQALLGSGLFGEKPTICIEEFLSKKKSSKETEAIIQVMKKNESETDIYLWESKQVTPAQINKLKKITVKEFKIPKTIFQFLDSIKPHNIQNMIKLFHQTIETEEEQFIFFMFIRHIRILLGVADEASTNNIDEVKRMAPWQKAKLQKQSALFTPEKLKQLYTRLYQIEKGIKTGTLPLTLAQSIDILLTTI